MLFTMNPYASYLGSRDAREVIGETAQRLEALLQQIGPARASERPAPGKWSAREIVCHLADSELVFAFRLRQIVSETAPVVQPLDQEKWANVYGAYDTAQAMAVFAVVRRWNIALVDSLAPEAFQRTLTHPERGAITFQTIIETMGGHDVNHLQQIEAIAGKAAQAG
jgi:hypothetical protein